ncbi:hypothetical protein J2Y03_005257 [Neobacillus niacini]|uniref:hypothetical protein n=1 Tax=Neobacillus niacini TaxID=86668 RepID=UPI0028560BB6|nr:hypothetical protein [Neobacillus niacini]MDR7080197.1 hypothetical protein [Neobacillus niacini]
MKKLLAIIAVSIMLVGCTEETTNEKPVEKEKVEQKAEQKPKEKEKQKPKGEISEIGGIKIQPLKDIFRKKDDVIIFITNQNDFEVAGTAYVAWKNRHGNQNEKSQNLTLKPKETLEVNFGNIEVNYIEINTDQKLETGNYTKPHLHFSTIWTN